MKSLMVVMPVACVLVVVRAPMVVAFQFAPSNRRITKLEVFAPASTSPATKLNVASYVENVVPLLERVQ